MKIAGVILAAGASRRMGEPKALLEWQSGTFLERVIMAFDLPVDPIVVVVRDADQAERFKSLWAGKYASYVVNPDPERGQLSSLQCGLAALPRARAFAFCPVDYPAIQPATVKHLVREFETHKSARVVIPRFESRHGHPVLIRRAVANALLAEPPTSSARDVLRRYAAQTLYVGVDDPGVVHDVDTREEYIALRQKLGTL